MRRLLDTLQIGLFWLPVMFIYAAFCFVRGEIAERSRARSARGALRAKR